MKIKIIAMNPLLENLKDFFWLLVTAFLSVLAPVENSLKLLLAAFVFNIFMGIIADVHVNKNKFNLRKAFNAFSQFFFYFSCVVFVDYGARLLGDFEIGKTGVKWLTYVVVYFYITNIFRNASLIYPKSSAIQFIYDFLSTQIFDRLKERIGFNGKNPSK
jgi:hypothetical protein